MDNRNIGDADHALDRNQQLGLLRGNGHIEGGPAELDDTTDPPTVTAPTPWSVYVDGETVEVDAGNNTVELPPTHPTLDRWDAIYIDPTGALQVESGEAAQVIGERGLQAREPAPPSFADIDGVVIAAAYRQFDEDDSPAFSLSDLFYDRRVRTLADIATLHVKNAEIEEGSAGELTVDSEPVDDVDVVRKLEADALQDNINSLNTDFEDHSDRHQNNGADELNVEGLSGDLADPQDPKNHSTRHQNNGEDEINVGGLSGDLADRQDPKDHANRHQEGGDDEIDAEDLASPEDGSLVLSAAGWQAPEGGTNVQVFESSGTWEKPQNVDVVFFEIIGGGGGGGTDGGGASTVENDSGGGGGGGGQATAGLVSVDGVSSLDVTIGAGGEEGSSGGTTSFGPFEAAGGDPGESGNQGNSPSSSGGSGGSGSIILASVENGASGGTGAVENSSSGSNSNFAGAGGGGGGGFDDDGNDGEPGDGGDSIMGDGGVAGSADGGPRAGGRGGTRDNDGGDGGFPGGGGGGAFGGFSSATGGTGGGGKVIVVAF